MRLLLLAVLALAGCGERVMPEPSGVYALSADWHVVSEDELRRVYADAGMPLRDLDKLHGFVGIRNGRHVIYTTAPRHVNDAATCALGHEFLHIALGDYHK